MSTPWPPPPWEDPERRRPTRWRTGTALGLCALGCLALAPPLFVLGAATLFVGIGLVILAVAAMAWIAVVPLALGSLFELCRSGTRPRRGWLLRCLPAVASLGTWAAVYAIGLRD